MMNNSSTIGRIVLMSKLKFSLPLLSIEEARARLALQGWTNRALAEWWGCSEEYVSKIINNPARKRHFDDSIRALPKFSDVAASSIN